ncbi:MAG: thiol peroxidase [Bacteroidales bacterium]|nr:thiol peroxidase [Bacteroidales bacterium]
MRNGKNILRWKRIMGTNNLLFGLFYYQIKIFTINDSSIMKENRNITSKMGSPLTIVGKMIAVGDTAPEFKATGIDGGDVKLSDFKGKTIIITAFPAIKTTVCSMRAREFNKRAVTLGKDVVVLGISKDDISDTRSFCIAEGIEGIFILSDKKYGEFGSRYGFEIKELGLLARGTVVINKDGKVVYAEYVSDIVDEPAYDKAINTAKELTSDFQFVLRPLPYKSNDLEPAISKESVEFHYGKHLQAYINNLNSLLEKSPLKGKPLKEIICSSEGALFNNAAQVFNHQFYFETLSPKAKQAPEGLLLAAIEEEWGTFEDFRKLFSETATKLFGSGWVWFVKDERGMVSILSTANADTPAKHNLIPLMTFDVWEHAYYIDYRNRRADHIEKLWTIIDWSIVEKRYSR